MELEKFNKDTGEWEEITLDDKELKDKETIMEVYDTMMAELEIQEVMELMEEGREIKDDGTI
jgi:DNA repair ATPase RecN|tara:strand:- start:275 stop:460 length:186 start_codon:yes stop_codon:yes gene_type:complete